MVTDCRCEEGITVGLIDGLIAICRIVAKRDLSPDVVGEALLDLMGDEDLGTIIETAKKVADQRDYENQYRAGR